MALPNLFIIGAPKAGTTSLHDYLDEHPEVQMSALKEPNFFAPHLDPIHEPRRVRRRDEYERLFDGAAAVRGEASTPYAEYPLRQGVPERIKQLVPEAKLIYLVRDPVERTVSHHSHMVATEGERSSLAEALADLSDPRVPWLCASLYGLQLDLYLRHFSDERILLVDQAELLADRRAALRRIFAFLEVDPDFESPGFDAELNKTAGRHRYPVGFGRFVDAQVAPRLRWVPEGARRGLRRSVERTFFPRHEPEGLDEAGRERLQEYFADEVARVRSLTGMEFPTWSV